MWARQLRAILMFPGLMAGVIPAVILWSNPSGMPPPVVALAGAALFAIGLTLLVVTIALFNTVGEGTLAPFDPPRKLVVRGIYRRVRNPMISGVFFMLFGEALVSYSTPLAIWAAIFTAFQMIYIPLSEEPGLVRRFGDDYLRYRENVPRWLPRLTPWEP